jgi:carbonic anhydrase
VAAALINRRIGLADNWLRHIQDVRLKHAELLEDGDDDQRAARLTELNVIEQVVNVCQTTVVQEAWERGQDLTIHGWVYSIHDGLVNDLHMSVAAPDELAHAYLAAVGSSQRSVGRR